MIRHLATFGLWLALLFVTDQLFTWAFNSVKALELTTGPDVARLDDVTPELVLLFVNVLVFASAGALLAWRIDNTWLSVLCGAGLGCAWLAGEIALRTPWFLNLPSHPTNYQLVVAFFGAVGAPLAGALGAYSYSRLRFVWRGRKHAT